MGINTHLNDQEMLDELLTLGRPRHPHLEDCEFCQTENQRLRQRLTTFGEQARQDAMRSEEFWDRQRTAICAQMPIKVSYSFAHTPRLAWVALASMLALGAILLGSGSPSAVPPQATAEQDDELLTRIEQAVQSDTPAALEPAALLAEEINNSIQPASNAEVVEKENRK